MIDKLPVLSLLIWLPIAAAVIILMTAGPKNRKMGQWIALLSSGVTFLLSLWAIWVFDASRYFMQFVEQGEWIPSLKIQYALGVDGIALPLIVLTSLMTLIVVIASWNKISDRPAQFLAAFLIMGGLMNGVFAATDAILFYVFWEAMLVPMFLIIGIWGGPNRIYATLKFFIYTFLSNS